MASRNSRSRTQTRPISSGVWFSLFLVFGIILWFFWRLPLVPFLWLGMLAGGITQQYPVNASGSRKDPPSDKQMMVYHRWKDMLAGLMPNADWLEIRRVSWWMGWMAGMLLGLNGAVWIALVDGLFGFMLAQGWSHYRNRRVDRRHVYKGVSIPAFLTKSPVWARLLSVSMPLLVFAGVLVFVLAGYMSWLSAVTLPGFVFLLLVWLLGRKPQSRYWRELVEGQQLLDGWLAGDDLQKAWSGAYLTQVNKIGSSDNPLIVYRIRLQGSDGKPRSNEGVFKLGVEALRAPALADGYRFVCLLSAKQKKKGAEQFDPSSVRLALGMDESCIPSIAERKAGEGLASLVADIAYAQTAFIWHKRAPLTLAHDVSADDSKAAWLLEIITPPQGGDSIDRISFDWLEGEGSPAETLRMPVFADLQDKFHLVAFDDAKLSDKGNKWRPDGMTHKKAFDDYITISKRFKSDQSAWVKCLPSKLNPPAPIYDYEKTQDCDGWQLHYLPLVLTAPATPADYERCDLGPLQPEARFIGLVDEGSDMAGLIWSTGSAPVRIDQLTGNTPPAPQICGSADIQNPHRRASRKSVREHHGLHSAKQRQADLEHPIPIRQRRDRGRRPQTVRQNPIVGRGETYLLGMAVSRQRDRMAVRRPVPGCQGHQPLESQIKAKASHRTRLKRLVGRGRSQRSQRAHPRCGQPRRVAQQP